jgi:nucleoside 2-deoxyribosyltransferase
MKLKVYLAGPMSGLEYKDIHKYFIGTAKKLKKFGFFVLHPLIGKDIYYKDNEIIKATGRENIPLSTNRAIISRDKWMVNQCDILFLNFLNCGGHISTGTCMELAWGFDKGKHCVVIMEKENVHKHAFILEAAHVIFDNIKDGINYMKNFQELQDID